MHRKIVFKGSLLTKDLTDEDRAALVEAFAVLHRLADEGTIAFQRSAGRTIVEPRKPDNVLTPQALTILNHAAAATEDFLVSDLATETGMNRNSATANLYRLTEAGYLSRRPVGEGASRGIPGTRTSWAYAITDMGRDVVASFREEPEESPGPRP